MVRDGPVLSKNILPFSSCLVVTRDYKSTSCGCFAFVHSGVNVPTCSHLKDPVSQSWKTTTAERVDDQDQDVVLDKIDPEPVYSFADTLENGEKDDSFHSDDYMSDDDDQPPHESSMPYDDESATVHVEEPLDVPTPTAVRCHYAASELAMKRIRETVDYQVASDPDFEAEVSLQSSE